MPNGTNESADFASELQMTCLSEMQTRQRGKFQIALAFAYILAIAILWTFGPHRDLGREELARSDTMAVVMPVRD